MTIWEPILIAAIVGVITAGISFLVNRSVFIAIDKMEKQIAEIFKIFREETPTNKDCEKSKSERDRMDAELRQQGKYISRFDERLDHVENDIEKLLGAK